MKEGNCITPRPLWLCCCSCFPYKHSWRRQRVPRTSLMGSQCPAGLGQQSHSPCKGAARTPAHHGPLWNEQQHPGEALAAPLPFTHHQPRCSITASPGPKAPLPLKQLTASTQSSPGTLGPPNLTCAAQAGHSQSPGNAGNSMMGQGSTWHRGQSGANPPSPAETQWAQFCGTGQGSPGSPCHHSHGTGDSRAVTGTAAGCQPC